MYHRSEMNYSHYVMLSVQQDGDERCIIPDGINVINFLFHRQNADKSMKEKKINVVLWHMCQ